MLNAPNIIKALVVSVVLTFLLSVGNAILFGSGITLDPGLDWEKVNSMTFSEATAYISSHEEKMSSWELFKAHIQWRAFITPDFFALMGSLFAGCVGLLWWVRGENAT
jgi:hypothetical protein